MKRNQKVNVQHWDNEEVTVVGLNEYGYLKVQRLDGSEHCLQPSGNRFDMMQNLIVLRT
jgi:biotin--protein ligase